ncbi:response regulator [Methylobacillus sp.]|uniref:response regulator n=1 Tax=Methylobacillus sp. TaxID=56818 RepID=UPI002FDFBD35
MSKLEPGINILVVEDEPQIRKFLLMAIQAEQFNAFPAETGERGLIEVGTRKPDIVIMDLGLPDMDGVEVIRQIRTWSNVPIIVLSARTQEHEKIEALDAGADDFLTKPFGAGELLARIRAQLRRRAVSPDSVNSVVRFGNIKIDLAKRQIYRDGIQVQLTPTEYRLLTVLVREANRVVSQRQLLKEVWGPNAVESSHYLRIYMGHLRNKLEDNPTQPQYFITELGVGYRLLINPDEVH